MTHHINTLKKENMQHKLLVTLLSATCLCLTLTVNAATKQKATHRLNAQSANIGQLNATNIDTQQTTSKFYLGAQTGIGSTNWSGLDGVIHTHADRAVLKSAPEHSNDTGMVVGVFAGYQLTKYLSIEANYMRLPDATIKMDNSAHVFYPNLPADGRFTSHTEAFDFTTHLRQEIFNTGVYAYGMAGGGYVYRHDIMSKRGTLSAAFGFGLDRKITKHINAEINFTYLTGQDKATVDPVNYYIPYIDTLNFGVSYQI